MLHIFMLLFLMVCIADYRMKKIPNLLLFLMLICVIRLCNERAGPGGAVWFLLQGAGTVIILFPLFRIGVIGAGDIKLLAVLFGVIPKSEILIFLFISMLIAGVISFVKLVVNKNLQERMQVLVTYFSDAFKSGNLLPYPVEKQYSRKTKVCLSGPMAISLLLYLGGVY